MDFFFSPVGRVSRQGYWLNFILPYTVAIIAFLALLYAVMGAEFWESVLAGHEAQSELLLENFFAENPALSILLLVIVLVLSWISIAVGFKRLHDRGRSGWWQFLPAVLEIPGAAADAVWGPAAFNTIAVGLVFGFFSLAISLWLFVVMLFLRGQPGENRFGPDPLAHRF